MRRRIAAIIGALILVPSAGLAVAAATPANAATAIFQENFDSGLGQFSADGYVFTGSYGVRMRGGSDPGVITSPSISTEGFTDITLTFDRNTDGTLDAGEYGLAEVSVDGGSSFAVVEATRDATRSRVTFALGPEAEDQPSVILRFRIDASLFYEEYEVDDVLLEGNGDGGGGGGDGPPSCTNLLPGQYDCSVDGRDVNFYVPASYDGSAAVPLVVDMHGYTSDNDSQQSLSGWDELADANGFLVAYPQGVSDSWNAQGDCCGSSTADDVTFIRNVVAHAQDSASIDAGRIYATGLSNGGSMTHTLACEAADLFAGASAVSYGLSGGDTFNEIVDNCRSTLSEGIPVVHFHGTDDGIVSYENGVLDSLGAEDSLEAWRQVQDASTSSTTRTLSSNTSCETHSNGLDGARVSLCTVSGGNHALYPDVAGAGIPSFSWDFFMGGF